MHDLCLLKFSCGRAFWISNINSINLHNILLQTSPCIYDSRGTLTSHGSTLCRERGYHCCGSGAGGGGGPGYDQHCGHRNKAL